MSDISQINGLELPVVGSDKIVVFRNGVAHVVTQADATLGTIDLAIEIASEASTVAATAATDDTPFGYSEAQANAIVTALNKVITNQNQIITAMVDAGWLTVA